MLNMSRCTDEADVQIKEPHLENQKGRLGIQGGFFGVVVGRQGDMPHSLWDLSSLTRDQTQALSSESSKSLPLACQEILQDGFFNDCASHFTQRFKGYVVLSPQISSLLVLLTYLEK